MSLELVPITIKAANLLVARWHRHHPPSQGGLFAVAVAIPGSDEPCGAAIIGRPVARNLQDGWTAEIVRLVTDGTRNAPSKLLGAAWRAARALGYRRIVTYTLQSESGSSLHGAGFKIVGEVMGRSWHCESRPRVDKTPHQNKFRWEKSEIS